MNEGFFVLAGFGFLLAQEKDPLIGPYSGKGKLSPFFKEGFDLIWQVLFLLLFYRVAIGMWIPEATGHEIAPPFFLLSAYVISRFRKRSNLFFLCVFSITLAATHPSAELSNLEQFLLGVFLSAGIVIFEWIFVGLKDKLTFSQTPKLLEDLPIYLIVASLLSLALWGVQTIFL